MQFIISVALHVCPLICATKEKQIMMVTVLYHIRKSNITHLLKTLDSVWKDFQSGEHTEEVREGTRKEKREEKCEVLL